MMAKMTILANSPTKLPGRVWSGTSDSDFLPQKICRLVWGKGINWQNLILQPLPRMVPVKLLLCKCWRWHDFSKLPKLPAIFSGCGPVLHCWPDTVMKARKEGQSKCQKWTQQWQTKHKQTMTNKAFTNNDKQNIYKQSINKQWQTKHACSSNCIDDVVAS